MQGAAGGGPAGRARPRRFGSPKKVSADGHAVTAPMHGIVAEVRVGAGDAVRDGQVVAIIEAMKMMNEVVAHRDGVVASVDVKSGDTVESGSPIITFAGPQ
jgi:biotin carboxyl carrier protein